MHGFAKLVAAATLFLIFAGGLVKSTETGLSDKTWPQFNGGYQPILRGETLFEHSHRLIAGTVALLTVGLAVTAFRREPRRWVRALAATAVVAVLAQAVLGGLTVHWKLESLAISLGHAGLAEGFLCLATALAVVTAPAWRRAHEELTRKRERVEDVRRRGAEAPFRREGDRLLRGLTALTALAVYGQILLGAWVRYTPGAPYAIPDFPLAYGGIIPPNLNEHTIFVQFAHRCGAAAVTLLAFASIARALRRHGHEPLVRRPALALAGLLCVQILLGGFTIWTVKSVLPTTLHVATGAAVLASSVVLALCAGVTSHGRTRTNTDPLQERKVRVCPRLSAARSLLADVATLTKLRLASLVLVATGAGYYLAAEGPIDGMRFSAAITGTALLAAAGGALNQLMEIEADALMARTADRPLPSGRMAPRTALLIGIGSAAAGLAILVAGANLLTALLGLVTLVTYVGIYTPLKRVTWVNTLVGAIPGALPPVMGWAAASGTLTADAWALFGIVFFWQLPHFFAIAWLKREDYARGGFPMLPVIDGDGLATANQIIFCCLALLPLSLVPAVHGLAAGPGYLVGALVLGLAFLGVGAAHAFGRSEGRARRLFIASLVYLPLLLGLMSYCKQA